MDISEVLDTSSLKSTTNRGRSCTELWKALRPRTSATLEQLEGLMRFESLVDRFDRFCYKFELPLETMAGLRISIARTMDLALHGRHDLREVSERLQDMIVEPDVQEVDRSSPLRPHFYETFEHIYARFALLSMNRVVTLSPTDMAKLGILGLRRTKNGFYNTSTARQSAVRRQLELLSVSVTCSSDEREDIQLKGFPLAMLLQRLNATEDVSLGGMELLQTESQTLGKVVASQAHLLCSDELQSLDSSLETMFKEVLHALLMNAGDSKVQQLARQLLSLLYQNTDSPVLFDATRAFGDMAISTASSVERLSDKLHAVAIYLRTSSHCYQNKLSSASRAWSAFALVCLHLYVPDIPYDPALEPRLRWDMHHRHREDLRARSEVLRSFREVLTGQAKTFRATLLNEEIDALGPGPPNEDVFRPSKSQLSDLQTDLDGVVRSLQQLRYSENGERPTLPLDPTSLASVIKLRKRLVHQYRAYDDITTPAVGFVDCLLTGQRLAICATTVVQQDCKATSLANIVPFVSAKLGTWLADQLFISVNASTLSQAEEICWLGAVSQRCSIKPISNCDPELRDHVHDFFQRQHTKWRAELKEQQQALTARSSVYKFKGQAADQEEPTQEELDELFPAHEASLPRKATNTVIKTAQELAPTIATLHYSLFAHQKVHGLQISPLMHQWLTVATESTLFDWSQDFVPAVIHAIGDLNHSFSTGDSTKTNNNMYTDANIQEVRKLSSLIEKTVGHFKWLHGIWLDHAVPVDVLRLCGHITELGHSLPLSRFLSPVEKLHGTINEWQMITSKEYSANMLFEEFTGLIVRWRRLELSTWAALFDREWEQCQRNSSSWWFVAYETIILTTEALATSSSDIQQHAADLLKTLDKFLSSSALGEFNARLRMLRGFGAHLKTRIVDVPRFDHVHNALMNLVAYYSHFEEKVSDMLANGRGDLEGEVKNIIQLASWKDRNIDVLRQSAHSSHRMLLRIVRKFRALLAQPVITTIEKGIPSMHENQERSSQQNGMTDLQRDSSMNTGLIALPAWNERPDRLRNVFGTAEVLQSKAECIQKRLDGAQQLKSFSFELNESVAELQKATPTMLTEDNKTSVNHLKTRKRRLLADVLKDVRQMGFQPNLGEVVLEQQASHVTVFTQVRNLTPIKAARSSLEAQHVFHRLVSVMPAVRDSSRKHSEDLTSAEVRRCTSLLESVLQVSIEQHESLASQVTQLVELQHVCDLLANFGRCIAPETNRMSAHNGIVRAAQLEYLLAILGGCLDTLRVQQTLSDNDYSSVIGDMESRCAETSALRDHAESLPQLPSNIQTADHAQLEAQLDALVNDLRPEIHRAISWHPEVQPIMAQLFNWIDRDDVPTTQPQSNAEAVESVDSWIRDFYTILDTIADLVHDAERQVTTKNIGTGDNSWLLTQRKALDDAIEELHVSRIANRLSDLLSKLQYLEMEREDTLSCAASVCRNLQPILVSFCRATADLIDLSCEFLTIISRTGHDLATSFLSLASRGFCAPSEKTQDDEKQAGEVESGTGLGEGEGAEDISKNIGDDEDISEAAQDTNRPNRSLDLEDQKDAVDMADEEMEGDVGETSQSPEEQRDDDAKEDNEDVDMEEESGEVDSSNPSKMEEKMWDNYQREGPQEEEAQSGQGKADQPDIRAAESKPADGGDGGEDEQSSHQEDATGPEQEQFEQQEPETMDTRPEDTDILDLPEDIAMDGRKAAESDFSDVESLADSHGDDQHDEQIGIDVDADGASDDHDGQDDFQGQERDEVYADQDVDQGDKDARDQGIADASMDDQQQLHEKAEHASNGKSGQGLPRASMNAHTPQPKADEAMKDQDDGDESQKQHDASADGKQDTGTGNVRDRPKTTEDEQRLPFKELGDVLQQWYDQHHRIEQAREANEQSPYEHEEDMMNAHFEHLPNEDAVVDTQALGATSADQSTALDKENAAQVKETNKIPGIQSAELPNEQEENVDDKLQDSNRQLEQSDNFHMMEHQTPSVDEVNDTDADVEMTDTMSAAESDMEDDVDQSILIQKPPADLSEELSLEDARELWALHGERTSNLALALTEQLRLILQPTQATKMRGDFRTGKRLNIKKIIPYIASSYKRDKIWMRRSVPSKRSYQVMLAIDDSKSMTEGESRHLAFESLALITKSMSMLEVGELSVFGFGEKIKIAHDFTTPFTSEAGAEIFRRLSFSQTHTDVRKMVARSVELFREARLKASGSASDLWQLQLIISDGICQDHPSIRQLVRQAHEERILMVFVIVDANAKKPHGGEEQKQSILGLQTAEFVKDSDGEQQLKFVKYLDTFPFRYYLIVRDIHELPGILAEALRQWFAEVVETAS